jgi:hypothetical protein
VKDDDLEDKAAFMNIRHLNMRMEERTIKQTPSLSNLIEMHDGKKFVIRNRASEIAMEVSLIGNKNYLVPNLKSTSAAGALSKSSKTRNSWLCLNFFIKTFD